MTTSIARPMTLDRAIGRWSLAALTVNCVAGAGILGLPGRVFALAGPLTGWVLAAAATLSIATALCLAALAGRFEAPGGPVEYCRAAFGRGAGFAAGWLGWTATVLAAASLLDLLAELVAPAERMTVTLIAGAALTGFTMIGAGRSAAGSAALTVAKLGVLAVVAIAGLAAPAVAPSIATGPFHPGRAIVLLFFAFVGFERPTAIAGETIDARRAVPFALIAGMMAVTVLYGALFAACGRGVADLATSNAPVAELATRLLGASSAPVVSAGAVVIVLGTLASQWITAPRLLFAMAESGELPAAFARLSPRRRTPDAAILATGMSAVLLSLGGSFVTTLAASSASRLLIFLGCAAALLRLERGGASPSRFRLPGSTLIAIAVIAACATLLVAAAAELSRLASIMCIGGLSWFLTTFSSRKLRR